MSYILDALKRADAERGRGHVPGLHTQPLPTPHRPEPLGRQSATRLMLIAGLGGVAIATSVWFWPVSVPVAVAMPIAAPVSPPLPAVATALPGTVTPLAQPRQPSPTLKSTPSVGVTAGTSQTPALLGALPAEKRREIPALTITGAVYSQTPANRLLLVNNLVLSQGDQAAPGVTLEEIGPKSSVFSFKGLRFRLAH